MFRRLVALALALMGTPAMAAETVGGERAFSFVALGDMPYHEHTERQEPSQCSMMRHRSYFSGLIFFIKILFFVVLPKVTPPFGRPPKKYDIVTRPIMPSTTRSKTSIEPSPRPPIPKYLLKNPRFSAPNGSLNPPCRFVNWT